MPARYDFAIFGTSPLSALLAGLLAHDHGRQVIRIAEPVSPQRLPRAIDIALPFATRPQTWRLLRRAEAETRDLLVSLGAADAVAPVRVRIVAEQPHSMAALAHASHMAAAYGMTVREGMFSRVPRLVKAVTLTDSKVASVPDAALTFDDDGKGAISAEGAPVEVGQIVLADDAAVLGLLPEDRRPRFLLPQLVTSTQTLPTRRLAAPIMRFVDRGVTLLQRPDHAVLGLIAGEHEVEARLASTLPGPFPLARRATSHFRRLVSRDGAPVVGRLGPGQPVIVAGLGDAGAFLAPPLARFLAGKASAEEQAFFAAHAPDAPRDAVADFAEVLP